MVRILLCLPLAGALRSVVVHWPRADTAGAAAWVHARREASDLVLGNDWTHHYYFRRLGPLFHDDSSGLSAAVGRVWVVYTAQAPAEDRFREALTWAAGTWRILEHRDFRFTTVLLLEGRARGASRGAASLACRACRGCQGAHALAILKRRVSSYHGPDP